jgi:hypothetical protein
MAHKLNAQVRQVVPVIVGDVKDVQYDATTQEFNYLVIWATPEGTQERWFHESQIEAVGEQA